MVGISEKKEASGMLEKWDSLNTLQMKQTDN